MKTGVVIGTYGTPGYVGLQLESLRRFASTVPVLIHDDSSGRREELARLAVEYGAGLKSTRQHKGHVQGDIAVFVEGLRWAKKNGLDYLVKISRRFVLISPWMTEFNRAISIGPQPATLGAADVGFRWRLRTEFLGLRVKDWYPLIPCISTCKIGPVETFMASLADLFGGFTCLSFLGESRVIDNGKFLWYNFASPKRYAQQGRGWGLRYEEKEFPTK